MLVDAAAVARYLGVTRAYVYEHADELGARRLGTGPKARLRFDLAEIEARLAPKEPTAKEKKPRRRRRVTDTSTVPLLPIRRPR